VARVVYMTRPPSYSVNRGGSSTVAPGYRSPPPTVMRSKTSPNSTVGVSPRVAVGLGGRVRTGAVAEVPGISETTLGGAVEVHAMKIATASAAAAQ
jgi:hypothetical protein